ncbi:MAG: hypothetical protein EU539_06115 [Promethearchaeota archaeon]|nr:MAG: hypothetical protein EU539_06115 [Candidatus Lokiarchaeota archaeon]
MIFDDMHEDSYHMMDWWTNIFGPFWWIFMVIWWVLWISSSIIMAYFVHKDAVRRKIPNPEIWLLIVLIFNVLGLLIYFLARGNYEEQN